MMSGFLLSSKEAEGFVGLHTHFCKMSNLLVAGLEARRETIAMTEGTFEGMPSSR